MRINAGDFNKRIAIYDRTTARDADGYDTGDDPLVHSCWAMFSRTSGSSITKAGGDFATTNVRFLIRHTNTVINTKMYVKYNGADYDITYINDYNDGHLLIEIWAERVAV